MDALSTVKDLTMSVNKCSTSDMSASVETLICMVVGVVMLHIEFKRRCGTEESNGSSIALSGTYASACVRFLRRCAPEAIGLVACMAFAVALRLRGDTSKPMNEEAWAEIKAQWPLLMTADTLLSLQAMLRLLVLLSASIRTYIRSRSAIAFDVPLMPLAGETSVLWLGAGLARVALMTQSKLYMLDGPLGGMLPAACEIAVLPLLFLCASNTLQRAPVSYTLMAAATGYFAFRNRLCLVGDHVTDSLFIIAHSFDLLAALAYMLRTLMLDNGGIPDVSIGFTHLLMPTQQALSTYYFLQAFDAVPALVGAGVPFAVLQIGNTLQLGAYLSAMALYFADCCGGTMHEGRNSRAIGIN